MIADALAKEPDERRARAASSSTRPGRHSASATVVVRDRKPLLLVALGAVVALGRARSWVVVTLGGGPGKPSTKPTLTPKVDSLQRIDPKRNKVGATIGAATSRMRSPWVPAGYGSEARKISPCSGSTRKRRPSSTK